MKKLQAENDLLLDVISSGTTNVYPYPPPVEPPQPNFLHQAPHLYPNPPSQPYSGRPHENFTSSYPHGQPPPPPPPPNHRHHHSHPRPHAHPDPHHRSPLLIQVNGGPPGTGTGPSSGGGGGGGAARNGYPGISTSHTRTLPMEVRTSPPSPLQTLTHFVDLGGLFVVA